MICVVSWWFEIKFEVYTLTPRSSLQYRIESQDCFLQYVAGGRWLFGDSPCQSFLPGTTDNYEDPNSHILLQSNTTPRTLKSPLFFASLWKEKQVVPLNTNFTFNLLVFDSFRNLTPTLIEFDGPVSPPVVTLRTSSWVLVWTRSELIHSWKETDGSLH